MKTKRAALVAIVVMGFALCGCDKPTGTSTPSAKEFPSSADITAADANALLDSDKSVTYLDVRTVKEFETSRPAGSWNIPFLVLDEGGNYASNADFLKITEASFDKDAKLVIGCQSGGRSKGAQSVLKDAGFTNVVNMLGGLGGKRSAIGTMKYEGWSNLKLPTESGSDVARSYETLRARAGS